MAIGNGNGIIQDIYVTSIPNSVSIGGSLRVGAANTSDSEVLKVLNVFPIRKVIRVQRHAGIAHTLGSTVDVLNNRITIPVKTTQFESDFNDIIYFNGPQSVGVGTTPEVQ